jgi:iron complex transport system ATP-binding protein
MSLRITDLSVELGHSTILHDVDLQLESGELVGLIGPNGSGKSTLLRAALGLEKICSGEVSIRGKTRAAYARRELAQLIAYLPQDHTVHWPLDVRSTVELGREPHLGPFQRLGKADFEVVAEVMRQTDTEKFAGRSVRSLSAGERARVLLARAMAVQAPYILADEPTAALDPRHQLAVMDLLRQQACKGTGVVVVVHDLMLVAQFCTRVCLLDKGAVVANGAPEEVLNNANISQVYGVATERVSVGGQSLVIPVALATV